MSRTFHRDKTREFGKRTGKDLRREKKPKPLVRRKTKAAARKVRDRERERA